MAKTFHNLSDEERDKLNLPPKGFQGEEFTTILQAPTSTALQKRVDQFRAFARTEHYETFEVLLQESDPDGGFKAIVTAHNWNPITWAAEKATRTYLGAKHGLAIGKRKAEIKHLVGTEAELAQAAEEETLNAQRKLAIKRAVEAERRRREPELAAARQRTIYSTPKGQPEDITKFIFG